MIELLEAVEEVHQRAMLQHRALSIAASRPNVKWLAQLMFKAQGVAVAKWLETQKRKLTEAIPPPQPPASSNPPPVNPADLQAILDQASANFTDAFATALQPATAGGVAAVTSTSATGATTGAAAQSGPWNIANQAAQNWLQNYVPHMMQGLDQTTEADVNDYLAQARKDGLSYNRMASDLDKMFADMTVTRAETVAITETARAYEYGASTGVGALVDMGFTYEKSWLADGNACGLCESNMGEGWIPYESGHDSGAENPPEHPRCECTELYQRPDGALDPGQLSDDEQAAFNEFDGEGGGLIDASLRDANSAIDEEMAATIATMDEAIQRNVIQADTTVYRKMQGMTCGDLKGKSIVDQSFGVFGPTDAVLESMSVPLSEATVSLNQIHDAIYAGNIRVADIAKYLGITGGFSQIAKAGIPALLASSVKKGNLSCVVKGSIHYYGLPGSPPVIVGAVDKAVAVQLKKGQTGLQYGGKTYLPRQSKYPVKSCGLNGVKATGVVKGLPPAVTLPTLEDIKTFEKIVGPLGSQGGQWYRDVATGDEYFVKPAIDLLHAKNEVASGLVYKLAATGNAPVVADVGILEDGSIITKRLAEIRPLNMASAEERLAAYELFGVDALLSNWDVAGLTGDNIFWNIRTGSAVRIDQGGSMLFRAQGGSKDGFNAHTTWNDWSTLRTQGSAKALFGKMTDEEVATSLEYAKANIDIEQLSQMWTDAGVVDPAWTARWRETIQARLDQIPNIVNELRGVIPEVGPSVGFSLADFASWKARVSSIPAHYNAAKYWVGGTYGKIFPTLNSKNPMTPAFRKNVEAIDRLIAAGHLSEDTTLFRAISVYDPTMLANFGTVGFEFGHVGFFASSHTEFRWSGNVRMTVKFKKGTPAAFLQKFGGLHHEQEVILPRGMMFRVVKANVTPYQTEIQIEQI